MAEVVARPTLYLSYDARHDLLQALEFGLVGDRQPRERWREVSDHLRLLLRDAGDAEVGFQIRRFSEFDPERDGPPAIWDGSRFDVPALGLRDATAGEIALAAAAFLGGESTLNRRLFRQAVELHGEEAAVLWRDCLEAGDQMAHYGLGYTLYELGRYRDAYRHLRAYTEMVPDDAWAWCWLGRASHALGELAEAETAYRRAMELSEAGEETTDAPALLERLRAGESADLPPDQEGGFIRETVFDSPVYLSGLAVEPTEPGESEAVALFIAGGPLSGKTTVLRQLTENGAAIIPADPVPVDPRRVRESIPEWPILVAERFSGAADAVYRECCDIARKLTETAVREQLNLIVDGVGGPGFAELLRTFIGIGYDVRVLLVDAPIEVAQQRNRERSQRDGLFIDPAELERLHREVSREFDVWRRLTGLTIQMYSGE